MNPSAHFLSPGRAFLAHTTFSAGVVGGLKLAGGAQAYLPMHVSSGRLARWCRIVQQKEQSSANISRSMTEALQTQIGQKDGQQLFVRENDGSVTAHLWSSSTSQWNLVSSLSLVLA